jgi:tetratricopeptide (TPR) repeat protein
MSEINKKSPNTEDIEAPVISEPGNSTRPSDIKQDPDFRQLESEFQQGHWAVVKKILEKLENKYPENRSLSGYREDLDLHSVIASENLLHVKKNKPEFHVHFTRSILIIIVSVIFTLVIGFLAFILIRNHLQHVTLEQKIEQINSLNIQVEALLNSGQPEKALEFVQIMKEIDPENPIVIEASAEVERLNKLNEEYLIAVEYLNQNRYEDALPLLEKINESEANFKDVPHLLESTTVNVEIARSLANGIKAYENKDWQDAIDNLERILELDPSNSDASIKDMLLSSYLKRIIQMLENDTTSIEDISAAETYYRRAIAMIPQSKVYLSERENLQKASRDLLQLKYAQTAYAAIENPAQTLSSVSDAVNFLKKASNLDSSNVALQTEVNKMVLYQAGFQYYLEMNWAAAIQQLTTLTMMEKTYANGYAEQMLYEAHMGRGLQYYNVGFYLDAQKEFEAAESLVLGKNNLLKRFSAELKIGSALWKMEKFEDSASYFEYAFLSINYENWGNEESDLVTGITDAINLYNVGSYKASSDKFVSLLPQVQSLFTEKDVTFQQGTCYAMIAADYNSSVQEILTLNKLPQQTRSTADQILQIPVIEN